jgi:hypothetical protein
MSALRQGISGKMICTNRQVSLSRRQEILSRRDRAVPATSCKQRSSPRSMRTPPAGGRALISIRSVVTMNEHQQPALPVARRPVNLRENAATPKTRLRRDVRAARSPRRRLVSSCGSSTRGCHDSLVQFPVSAPMPKIVLRRTSRIAVVDGARLQPRRTPARLGRLPSCTNLVGVMERLDGASTMPERRPRARSWCSAAAAASIHQPTRAGSTGCMHGLAPSQSDIGQGHYVSGPTSRRLATMSTLGRAWRRGLSRRR